MKRGQTAVKQQNNKMSNEKEKREYVKMVTKRMDGQRAERKVGVGGFQQ